MTDKLPTREEVHEQLAEVETALARLPSSAPPYLTLRGLRALFDALLDEVGRVRGDLEVYANRAAERLERIAALEKQLKKASHD